MRARNVDDDDDLHLQNQATKTENNKYDLSAPKTLNLTTTAGPNRQDRFQEKSLNVVSRIHKQLFCGGGGDDEVRNGGVKSQFEKLLPRTRRANDALER